MKKQYKTFTKVTKEILDDIKVGDLVKVNNWMRPLKVRAVSENYFVMAAKYFGKWNYSVCEKKPWDGFRRNAMVGGMFHVGTDGWLFGSPVFPEGYDFDNAELSQKYIDTFELPEHNRDHAFISVRRAVPIHKISIKEV